jgi:hypothetical protein
MSLRANASYARVASVPGGQGQGQWPAAAQAGPRRRPGAPTLQSHARPRCVRPRLGPHWHATCTAPQPAAPWRQVRRPRLGCTLAWPSGASQVITSESPWAAEDPRCAASSDCRAGATGPGALPPFGISRQLGGGTVLPGWNKPGTPSCPGPGPLCAARSRHPIPPQQSQVGPSSLSLARAGRAHLLGSPEIRPGCAAVGSP